MVLSSSSDPRPTPRLLVWCFKGEEPQTIITTAYIPRVKPVMTYSDDARSASSEGYMSSWPPGAGTNGGR